MHRAGNGARILLLAAAAWFSMQSSSVTAWLAASRSPPQQPSQTYSPATFTGAHRHFEADHRRGGPLSSSTGLRAYSVLIKRTAGAAKKLDSYIRRYVMGEKLKSKVSKAEAFLRKRGISLPSVKKTLWHETVFKAGDVMAGQFQHPEVNNDMPVNIRLTASGPEGGEWEATGMGVPVGGPFFIQADFPVRTDAAGKRIPSDVAKWLFQKYSSRWKDNSLDPPTAEELTRLDIDELRQIFLTATGVKEFPGEEEYRQVCSDPDSGMSLEEFTNWITSQDPDWFEAAWEAVGARRRAFLYDEDLELDGDFVDDIKGMILGFASFGGRPGGTFNIRLQTPPQSPAAA